MKLANYYEFLQISPNAEPETVHRVYRFLAARLHPDNPYTGNPQKFFLLKEAYEVLADPDRRAEYDASCEKESADSAPMSNSLDFMDSLDGELNRRLAVLALLYLRRRTNPDSPEVSLAEVEKKMGFPREYLQFTIWYLQKKGYITRADNSAFTLTADGVDFVELQRSNTPVLNKLLTNGSGVTATSSEPGHAPIIVPVSYEDAPELVHSVDAAPFLHDVPLVQDEIPVPAVTAEVVTAEEAVSENGELEVSHEEVAKEEPAEDGSEDEEDFEDNEEVDGDDEEVFEDEEDLEDEEGLEDEEDLDDEEVVAVVGDVGSEGEENVPTISNEATEQTEAVSEASHEEAEGEAQVVVASDTATEHEEEVSKVDDLVSEIDDELPEDDGEAVESHQEVLEADHEPQTVPVEHDEVSIPDDESLVTVEASGATHSFEPVSQQASSNTDSSTPLIRTRHRGFLFRRGRA